jgi:hypothetical protein
VDHLMKSCTLGIHRFLTMLPSPKMAISIETLDTRNLIFPCENAWSYLQIH